MSEQAGLDFFSIGDHPLYADRVDAYAALGFTLGATEKINGSVICSNLLSRPAPILARTIAGLSALSAGRIILTLGAGGSWKEIVALGAPRLSAGQRIRNLEEAILLIKALSGGGNPVTFDGEFYQVTDLPPTNAALPPIWVGAGGPKGLAVVGRHADSWIPPHAADWRSPVVTQGWPLVEEAAASAGRDPNDVGISYLVAGRITAEAVPTSELRNTDSRWTGGSVEQWVDELSYAIQECRARAFNFLVPPDAPSLDDQTVRRWSEEVVPRVREAVSAR
jgi:alkanesulfonate monooxygenase SsuD/methylene tetrahydromethanopterin reductase-like flavin-dependent oxidoreductase (luciferase family)